MQNNQDEQLAVIGTPIENSTTGQLPVDQMQVLINVYVINANLAIERAKKRFPISYMSWLPSSPIKILFELMLLAGLFLFAIKLIT